MIHAVGADWSLLSLCSAQLSSPVSEVRITTGWTFHKHTLSWRKRLAGSFAFLLQQKWHWRRCVQELYYVITGSAASSHMRLDASGVCHEEMWAYSGGPAAVCLHCSVRCNCSRFSCRSCFFLGTFSLLLPSGQAGQYGGTAPLLNYTATGDFY